MRETKEMREVYRDFLLEHVEKREDLAVLEADLSSSMKTDSLKKKMGKTLLARAVAHHTDCKFIRVSGSELVQKYIGGGR